MAQVTPDVEAELLTRLGFETGVGVEGPEFRWEGRVYGWKEDVLVATVPDPRDPARLLAFVHGNDPELEARWAAELVPATRPWLRILRRDGVAIEAPVKSNGQADPSRLRREAVRRYEGVTKLVPQAPTGGLAVVRLAGAFPAGAVEQSTLRCATARRKVSAWCGVDEVPEVSVDLTSAAEDLAWHGERAAQTYVAPAMPHALVYLSGTVDDGGAGVARASLRAILGRTSVLWLEDAVATDAANTWFGVPLEEWCARLTLRGELPTIAELLSPEATVHWSRHVVVPLRALLVRRLRAQHGDFAVVRLWRAELTPVITAEETRAFHAAVRAQSAERVATFAAAAANRRGDQATLLRFTVSLAHELRVPELGPASDRWLARLDELRARGVSGLSLPVVLVARPEAPPTGGVSADLELGFAEGDLPVWAAMRAARARGMAVHLDLTLQWSPSGPAMGATVAGDAEVRARLFDRWADLVEHAALLAQLGGADSLSIGNATPQVVIRNEDPQDYDWRSEGWKRVIGRARAAFDGLLTYTASNPLEVEQASFWSQLDRVGYAVFPDMDTLPVGRDPDARAYIQSDTRWQVDAALEAAAKVGKPLWLARVGFERGAPGWQELQWRDFERYARTLDSDTRYAGFCVWRLPVDASGSEHPRRDTTVIDSAAVTAALRALTGR